MRPREAEELTSGHTAEKVDPGRMPGMAGSLCALEYSIQCILTASTRSPKIRAFISVSFCMKDPNNHCKHLVM